MKDSADDHTSHVCPAAKLPDLGQLAGGARTMATLKINLARCPSDDLLKVTPEESGGSAPQRKP